MAVWGQPQPHRVSATHKPAAFFNLGLKVNLKFSHPGTYVGLRDGLAADWR